MRTFIAETRKAIGVAVVMLAAWAGKVIDSPSGGITRGEWKALIAIGVAVAACYQLTNDPKPEQPVAP